MHTWDSSWLIPIHLSNAGIVGPVTKLGDNKAQAKETEISKAHLSSESFQVSSRDILYRCVQRY